METYFLKVEAQACPTQDWLQGGLSPVGGGLTGFRLLGFGAFTSKTSRLPFKAPG